MLQSSIAVSFKNTSDTTTELILENIPMVLLPKSSYFNLLELVLLPMDLSGIAMQTEYNVTTQICEKEDNDDYEGNYKEDKDEEEEEVEKTLLLLLLLPLLLPLLLLLLLTLSL
jgi:hypothetical protein